MQALPISTLAQRSSLTPRRPAGLTVFCSQPHRAREQPLTNPQLTIEGGQPLRGTVRVSGSKNGADYALAACLLTGEECVLENVPEIEDVRVRVALQKELTATLE